MPCHRQLPVEVYNTDWCLYVQVPIERYDTSRCLINKITLFQIIPFL